MATITLAELQLQSRQRADMVNSEFVSDSELTSYINNSAAELYDLLCEAYGSDYYVESEEGTTVADQADYDLPDDFYELKAVDLQTDASNWVNVQRFNFNERNRNDSAGNSVLGYTACRYRLVGNQLKFSPVPPPSSTYRVWYVPTSPALSAASDTLEQLNGYSEYIIVDVAIKMLQKEESDVRVLLAQKMALQKRITDKAQNRDANQATTITDIEAEDNDLYWRRS